MEPASPPRQARRLTLSSLADPAHPVSTAAAIQEEEAAVTRLTDRVLQLMGQQASDWDSEDQRRAQLKALYDEKARALIRVKELEWTQLLHDDPQRAQEAVGAVLSKTQQDIASAQLELVEAERVVQKRETEVVNRDNTLTCYLSSPTRRAIPFGSTLTGLKGDCQHARTRLWDAHRHVGNLFCSHSYRLRFDAWTAWARRLAANEALPDYGERPPSPPACEHAPAYNELYPQGRPETAFWPRSRHDPY